MRHRLLRVGLGVSAAVAAAGLAACGGSSPKGDVNTAFNKTLKATILVDSRGRSLYSFDLDSNNTPSCYDDATYHCSKAWPPLLVHGAVKAGKGVSTSLLRTVKRTDGTVQVTYNRRPLNPAGAMRCAPLFHHVGVRVEGFVLALEYMPASCFRVDAQSSRCRRMA